MSLENLGWKNVFDECENNKTEIYNVHSARQLKG